MKTKFLLAITAALTVAASIISAWQIGVHRDPSAYTMACDRYAAALASIDGELNTLGGGPGAASLKAKKSDIEKQRSEDKSCHMPSGTPTTGTPTTSTTASSSPSPSSTTSTSVSPSTSGSGDSWTPHFYHKDPATLPFSFGPKVEQQGATEEWWTRLANDPSLACADGGLVAQGKILGSDCTRTLIKSRKARDSFVQTVRDNVASTEVVERQGTLANTYEMVMVDGIPVVMPINNVPRPGKYLVLRVHTKGGKSYDFRLECGFQPDQPISALPLPMGQPIEPAGPCINGNGRDSEARCGDTPRDTVTPSPTPTTTPTGTPTTGTPTPTTSTSTTPPPSTTSTCPPGKHWDDENKGCMDSKGNGSNMPNPNPGATQNPSPSNNETAAPPAPAPPANPAVTPGSGTTGQAPGAIPTTAPVRPTGSVPSGTNPSRPNNGDQDPDGH